MSYVPLKQPLLQDDGGYDYEETILAERNQQAKDLANDVYHLKGAMDDLKMLVDEQGEMLIQADNNTSQANMDVEIAIEELEQAYVYKNNSRKKLIVICIILLIIIGIVVGVSIKLFKK